MKILIELPTWLGDTVMVSPAIENLVKYFSSVEIILLGPLASIDVLKSHPKVVKTYVLDRSFVNSYQIIKSLGEFDIFFSFRGSLRSKFNKLCVSSKIKYQYDKRKHKKNHQVQKYNNFINRSLNINYLAGNLSLYAVKTKRVGKNKLLGINPGASYGSAKRWYPKEFADLAGELSNEYDIIIFGGPGEKDIAIDIENYLIEKGVNNYLNLSDKLSITDLMNNISRLDLFITGDSGPMHLAAAFQIPTVSIFGPTKDNETSQWMNRKSMIVKKNLDCQPCMKRSCPLGHHNCMKLVKSKDVLEAIKTFD